MQENSFVKSVLDDFIPHLWKERKLFYWVVPSVFILSCALILCVPRYYKSSVVLAPESSGSSVGGSLGSLASSFGINLGSATTQDAIYPSLYPDVIGSTKFRLSLLDVPVVNSEGEVETYRDHLINQAHPFWWYPQTWLKRSLAVFKKQKQIAKLDNKEGIESSLIQLDLDTQKMLKGLKQNIQCSVDMRTDVITINTTDQDPLVAALLADTVRVRLQNYITNYRTNKTQIDMLYYQTEMEKANQEYIRATEVLCQFEDANMGTLLGRHEIERERLTQEKDVAYTVFSSFQSQYLAACAKLQDRTPAFTIIEQAVVSPKPAGPKRMIFVAIMTLLSILCSAAWILREELIEWF